MSYAGQVVGSCLISWKERLLVQETEKDREESGYRWYQNQGMGERKNVSYGE